MAVAGVLGITTVGCGGRTVPTGWVGRVEGRGAGTVIGLVTEPVAVPVEPVVGKVAGLVELVGGIVAGGVVPVATLPGSKVSGAKSLVR